MKEIQRLAHSRIKGEIYFHNAAQRASRKILRYVNEVRFEMFKTALKDTYLGVTTPTELKNEVATCRKMYDEKENQVIINQSINEFYTRFLFKIDALP